MRKAGLRRGGDGEAADGGDGGDGQVDVLAWEVFEEGLWLGSLVLVLEDRRWMGM